MVKINVVIMFGIVACSFVAACVHHIDRTFSRPPDYDLVVTDEPSLRHFQLHLKSKVDFPFCIESESWPNSLGQPEAGSQRIKLHWKGGEASAKSGFEEYCPGGCETVIPAGGTLIGQVGYDAFGDPEWVLSLTDRRLEVKLTPFRCRESR